MKNIGGNKWIADLGHIAAATEINFKFVVESENFGRRAETGEVRNFDVPVLRGGETRFTYISEASAEMVMRKSLARVATGYNKTYNVHRANSMINFDLVSSDTFLLF